jgi:hypothetical protein
MMFVTEPQTAFDSPLGTRKRTTPRTWSAVLTLAIAKLRVLAPYAAIELVMPGGSLMALLLWVYRRQKKVPVFPDSLDTLL